MSELRRIQLRFIPNNKWTSRSNAESKLSPLLNSTLVARCRLLAGCMLQSLRSVHRLWQNHRQAARKYATSARRAYGGYSSSGTEWRC